MSSRKTVAIATASAIGGLCVGAIAPVHAQLGSILKGGGIVLVVDKFGKDIDRFIDGITGNRGEGATETRVVPILTLGSGVFAGAAQVSGPKANVDRVKAVAQIEGQTKIPVVGEIRGRGLVPIADRSVKGDKSSLSRVQGVGVSGLIDIKL